MVERETIYLSGKKNPHIYYKKITIKVKIKQNENNLMSMTLWWTKLLSSLFVVLFKWNFLRSYETVVKREKLCIRKNSFFYYFSVPNAV